MGDAGLSALALSFPSVVRDNGHFRSTRPDLVAEAQDRSLARLFDAPEPENEFDRAMQPYLRDPFRGTVERRVLGPDETSVGLEVDAARKALDAAGVDVGEIDCLVSSAFPAHHVGIGNAVHVARELGLDCEAWNLETACSGSVVGLRTAYSLVRAEEHRRVLLTVSCTYSRPAVEDDTLGWFLGDGAAAFLIEPRADGAYLGGYAVHTADTCGTWYFSLELDEGGDPKIAMRMNPGTGRAMSRAAGPTLRRCVTRAAERAGVHLDEIAFFVFNTPTAWFADFAAKELGIARDRTISTYPRYANIGPVLMPANLAHAAEEGRLADDSLVLLFSIGSVSSASAAVLRWSDRVRVVR